MDHEQELIDARSKPYETLVLASAKLGVSFLLVPLGFVIFGGAPMGIWQDMGRCITAGIAVILAVNATVSFRRIGARMMMSVAIAWVLLSQWYFYSVLLAAYQNPHPMYAR